jgi:hypothetical protein
LNSFWYCFVGEKNDDYTLFMVFLFFEQEQEQEQEQELDLLDLVIFKMEKATNKWHNISYKV